MTKLEMVRRYNQGNFFESVARVVHDINSPIATMEIGLHLLSQEVKSDNLLIIKSALQTVRDITKNFYCSYYENHEPSGFEYIKGNQVESLNLKLLIDDVISEKLCEWLDSECELTFTYSPDANNLHIEACATEIKRMISNLLNNALEACSGIATINVDLTTENGYVLLSISDNGVGIDGDNVELYLSGMSTKHSGKGLGLSGARACMEGYGGEISISSLVGIGTVLELRFPIPLNEIKGG